MRGGGSGWGPGSVEPLANRCDHFRSRRYDRERRGNGVAFAHRLAIDKHGELPVAAGLFLHLEAQRLPKPCRHPGGRDRGESAPAVTNHHSAHATLLIALPDFTRAESARTVADYERFRRSGGT